MNPGPRLCGATPRRDCRRAFHTKAPPLGQGRMKWSGHFRKGRLQLGKRDTATKDSPRLRLDGIGSASSISRHSGHDWGWTQTVRGLGRCPSRHRRTLWTCGDHLSAGPGFSGRLSQEAAHPGADGPAGSALDPPGDAGLHDRRGSALGSRNSLSEPHSDIRPWPGIGLPVAPGAEGRHRGPGRLGRGHVRQSVMDLRQHRRGRHPHPTGLLRSKDSLATTLGKRVVAFVVASPEFIGAWQSGGAAGGRAREG